MSADIPISETRHGHILAELASLGLTLARELHARAMAAESPEEAVRLAGAFHQISRGVRQSLALEAKLGRDQQAHELQHAPMREKDRLAQVSRRHTQVFRAVERMAWTEAESDNLARGIVEDLGELLDFEALDDGFLAEPLAQQIDRIRARFGLIGDTPAGDTAAGDPAAAEATTPTDPEAGDLFEASDETPWGARIAGLPNASAHAHDTS